MADVSNKKVAILVATNFEQAEFTGPKQALEDAGVQVTVVSSHEGPLQGMNHDDEKADTFTADAALESVDFTVFDGLVLPGGTINADTLRQEPLAQQAVRDFLESGKLVAAICHAPWLLVSADVVDGRRLTSFPSLCVDIQNAGGDWVDETVVIDDNLITSRNPDDIPAFNQAIIDKLSA